MFDFSVVRSAHDVRRDARQLGFKAHFERVFGICVENGAELDEAGEEHR